MAFLYRSDTQILNPFSEYISEQTTLRSSFITSGLVDTNPVITENIRKGDTFQIPNWAANLQGAMQVPQEGVMATVNKLGSNIQRGVVHHRLNAWGASELAKLAVGAANDPMAAIGAKVATYVANAQQADLLATLQGLYGIPGTSVASYAMASMVIDGAGSGETDFSVSHVVRGDGLLGEDGDAYGILFIHPDLNAFLKIREMINYVRAGELPGITASTIAAGSITASNAVFGDSSGQFETNDKLVPTFAGKRVIVSDDAPRTGTPGNYRYMSYLAKPGAVGMGYQSPVRTESDRDILTSGGEDILKVQYDMCFHVLGSNYAGPTGDGVPTAANLAAPASWTRVFSNKNIPMVGIVHTCPIAVL
jgi:hypothetical protein